MVQLGARPTGSAESDGGDHGACMSLLLKHLRHKYSPAARRGREAARKHTARLEYEGWVAAQKKAFQPDDRTAPTKP